MRARTAALGPFDEVAKVADHRVPVGGGEIAVRVYSPSGPGPHPVLVFYHGGGWVIGDLYTHDGICRSLTNAAGCAVASVDYRLAPEAKYPVAAEDSYAALRWVVDNAGRLDIDPAARGRGGRQRRGQPRHRGRPDGARPTRPVARAPDADLSGDRSRVRHAVVPGERHRIRAHPGGHALVLAPLPRPRRAGRPRPTRPPCAPGAWPGCRPHSCSPPSATRSATRARPTPPGFGTRACP